MADVERISISQDQVEDTKETNLPLTPVSDGNGFKHGDHEDRADAPNGTPVLPEPADDSPAIDDVSKTEKIHEEVGEAPAEPVPVVSPPPKPKAPISADARTRKTSLQVGKNDPKAATLANRKTSATRSPLSTSTATGNKTPTASNAKAIGTATVKPNADSSAVRRTSLAHGSKPSVSSTIKPAATPSAPRASVGGATAAKPARAVPAAKPTAPARSSVTSPASTARPAASVGRPRPSETGSSASLPTKRSSVVKPGTTVVPRGTTPTQRKTSSPAPKPDGGLTAKYHEAIDELKKQTERISTLEETISALEVAIEQHKLEVAGHKTLVSDLRAKSDGASAARDAVDVELSSLKEKSNLDEKEKKELQVHLDDAKNQISEVTSKFQDAESSRVGLSSRVGELENTLSELRAVHDALKNDATERDGAAAAAAIEHEALLKARADLEAIRAESGALAATHKVAAEQAALQIKELEAKLSSSEATLAQLRSEVSTLVAERDELKNRVSELEVEILEIREANEVDADDHAKELAKLKEAHTKELADAKAHFQTELEAAGSAHEEAVRKWEEAIAAASREHSASLDAAVESARESAAQASRQNLESLKESHAKTVEDLNAQSAQELFDLKQVHEQSTNLVAEEMSRLQSELASQEDKYAAKVKEVKAAHDKLVDEAYQRAKAEADALHSKDLSDLRARSDTAIEEIRAGHRTELSNIKATHDEALDADARSYEKRINSLTVESNAAREDLAKAKSTVSAQAAELELLRDQLNSAKGELEKAIAAPATVIPSAELEAAKNELHSLKSEYGTLKGDYQALQGTFDVTTKNHALELEEAAKSRVQAIAELESKHQAEQTQYTEDLASIRQRMEDERDAKDRTIAALTIQRPSTPSITPRFTNQAGGVSKEELERLYHAHNAKLAQLENEHKQTVAQLTISLMELKEEKEQITEDWEHKLRHVLLEKKQLAEELDRKNMELGFQEDELNETQDEVKKLQDELEGLRTSQG